LTAILLALGASMSWGVSDFLAGLATRRLGLAPVLAIVMPAGLLAGAVVVAVRWQAPPNASFAAWAVATGLLGVGGIAALYRGLALGRMGIVAPIAATAPLIPVVFGLIRGERPSLLQGAGMGLALVGVVAAGREHDRAAGRRLALGAGLGLAAAVCFGVSLITLDEAANRDPYWASFVIRLAGTTAVALFLLGRRLPARAPRTLLPALVGVGLLDVGGTILFAVSTTKGLISVVSVIVSFFPVVVAFLARVTLGERLERVQLAGAAAAIAGVALISAG
jgi:drug/metabolite transporter (DMT)-like permease